MFEQGGAAEGSAGRRQKVWARRAGRTGVWEELAFVQVITELTRVNIERHRRRRVADHPVGSLDVDTCRGWLVTQPLGVATSFGFTPTARLATGRFEHTVAPVGQREWEVPRFLPSDSLTDASHSLRAEEPWIEVQMTCLLGSADEVPLAQVAPEVCEQIQGGAVLYPLGNAS